MKFIYQYARLPSNKDYLRRINEAAERLFHKLQSLPINSLNISDYTKNYLSGYLTDLENCLMGFSYILVWATAAANLPLKKLSLLDYGGGSGILSLLAKELQIGTVIYNDIYQVSCQDARLIAEAIGNPADYYVWGGIDEVIKFLKTNSLECQAIASNDVLEHIYDIKKFLYKVNTLPAKSLTIAMASGANMFNSRIRQAIMKDQLKIEYQDRKQKWGDKPRDCLKAYFQVRKEIISKQASSLNSQEIEHLTKATRGMIVLDIKKTVAQYLRTKTLPPLISHDANTCDPYTGNWAEQLMNPYELKNTLLNLGFKTDIISGYYGYRPKKIKRLITTSLNLAISLLKNQGLRIAPFYLLYGHRPNQSLKENL